MPEPNQPVYDRTTNSYRTGSQGAASGVVLQTRQRFTAAQINAGADIVPAVPGRTPRFVLARMIAVGSAVTGATAIVILGTRAATPVTLVSVPIAGLTQGALVEDGDAGATLLTDGASHTALDPGTAITIGKTGGAAVVTTGVDVIVEYAFD
jgi:hypothetical protein